MLAWEDQGLRTIADYFELTGIVGYSSGFYAWVPFSEVYTNEVHAKLIAMHDIFWPGEYKVRWDEWGSCFT
jgi:hypothetical protein